MHVDRRPAEEKGDGTLPEPVSKNYSGTKAFEMKTLLVLACKYLHIFYTMNINYFNVTFIVCSLHKICKIK
jgi:hypothetical protein